MVLAIGLKILGHLGGQFAGRFQDQAARHHRAAAAVGENVDHRQHEAGGLAGAGLRDRDQIAHHQHGRDRLGLDRRGRVIALGGYRLDKFGREAEIGKGHKSGISGRVRAIAGPLWADVATDLRPRPIAGRKSRNPPDQSSANMISR